MIIVKITVFLVLITILTIFFIRLWAGANPTKFAMVYVTKNFPKWFYLYVLLLLFDIIGIIASAIYLLFIR